MEAHLAYLEVELVLEVCQAFQVEVQLLEAYLASSLAYLEVVL